MIKDNLKKKLRYFYLCFLFFTFNCSDSKKSGAGVDLSSSSTKDFLTTAGSIQMGDDGGSVENAINKINEELKKINDSIKNLEERLTTLEKTVSDLQLDFQNRKKEVDNQLDNIKKRLSEQDFRILGLQNQVTQNLDEARRNYAKSVCATEYLKIMTQFAANQINEQNDLQTKLKDCEEDIASSQKPSEIISRYTEEMKNNANDIEKKDINIVLEQFINEMNEIDDAFTKAIASNAGDAIKDNQVDPSKISEVFEMSSKFYQWTPNLQKKIKTRIENLTIPMEEKEQLLSKTNSAEQKYENLSKKFAAVIEFLTTGVKKNSRNIKSVQELANMNYAKIQHMEAQLSDVQKVVSQNLNNEINKAESEIDGLLGTAYKRVKDNIILKKKNMVQALADYHYGKAQIAKTLPYDSNLREKITKEIAEPSEPSEPSEPVEPSDLNKMHYGLLDNLKLTREAFEEFQDNIQKIIQPTNPSSLCDNAGDFDNITELEKSFKEDKEIQNSCKNWQEEVVNGLKNQVECNTLRVNGRNAFEVLSQSLIEDIFLTAKKDTLDMLSLNNKHLWFLKEDFILPISTWDKKAIMNEEGIEEEKFLEYNTNLLTKYTDKDKTVFELDDYQDRITYLQKETIRALTTINYRQIDREQAQDNSSECTKALKNWASNMLYNTDKSKKNGEDSNVYELINENKNQLTNSINTINNGLKNGHKHFIAFQAKQVYMDSNKAREAAFGLVDFEMNREKYRGYKKEYELEIRALKTILEELKNNTDNLTEGKLREEELKDSNKLAEKSNPDTCFNELIDDKITTILRNIEGNSLSLSIDNEAKENFGSSNLKDMQRNQQAMFAILAQLTKRTNNDDIHNAMENMAADSCSLSTSMDVFKNRPLKEPKIILTQHFFDAISSKDNSSCSSQSYNSSRGASSDYSGPCQVNFRSWGAGEGKVGSVKFRLTGGYELVAVESGRFQTNIKTTARLKTASAVNTIFDPNNFNLMKSDEKTDWEVSKTFYSKTTGNTQGSSGWLGVAVIRPEDSYSEDGDESTLMDRAKEFIKNHITDFKDLTTDTEKDAFFAKRIIGSDPNHVNLNDSPYNGGYVDLNMPNALDPNVLPSTLAQEVFTLIFTPIKVELSNSEDSSEKTATYKYGRPILHQLSLYSPLVFSFETKRPQTIDQRFNVKFDLNGDGSKEVSSWIYGKNSAFLALDINNNGIIDNGLELFGEGTKNKNGGHHPNGYKALKMHDSNGDNFIDKEDPVFSKLLLWFDHNIDGKSQKEELVSLAEKGIHKISVNYKEVDKSKQFENGSIFKYESEFYGPNTCLNKTCKSYDIFFTTSLSVAHKNE